MPVAGLDRTRPCLALVSALLAILVAPLSAADEVRALWVVRSALTSPESIDAMVQAASDGGFNTLLVQVRGRGDAYFHGGPEPRAAALGAQPASFDPLARVIAAARAEGLHVHAWVNVNLVASVSDLPLDAAHIASRRPEWLMVPRDLVQALAGMDPRRPEYLAELVAFTGARPDEIEGLYLSPLTAEAAAYTTGVIADLARRYDVDGVHLDYARFPSEAFDFSASALEAFRQDVLPDLDDRERARLDARRALEPAIYADMFPERWRAFRRNQLTRLVVSIRQAVRAAKPGTVFSAAVFPDAADAIGRRFQDWPSWAANGLLDVVCPMAYTTDPAVFSAQIANVQTLAAPAAVWSGIGAYRLAPDEIVTRVRAARDLGVDGVVLFSYDSLAGTTTGPALVSEVGREAFAPAVTPP